MISPCAVGGEILDLALARAKKHTRFVMCGGISTYNDSANEVRGPKVRTHRSVDNPPSKKMHDATTTRANVYLN